MLSTAAAVRRHRLQALADHPQTPEATRRRIERVLNGATVAAR